MATKKPSWKLESKRIGRSAMAAIDDMVRPLLDDDASDDAKDKAREAILADALSCEIVARGASMADLEPTGYELLLSTGGPAVRIVGELDKHAEPQSARLEVQDWFQPWTEVPADENTLLAYAASFYFG